MGFSTVLLVAPSCAGAETAAQSCGAVLGATGEANQLVEDLSLTIRLALGRVSLVWNRFSM